MQKPRSLDFIRGVSVINLDMRSGIFELSLLRYWDRMQSYAGLDDDNVVRTHYTPMVEYELVLSTPDKSVCYSFPIERKQAAQMIATDRAHA